MSFYKNQYESFVDNTYQSIPFNPTYNNDRYSYKNPPQRPGSYNQMTYKPSNFRPGSSHGRRSGLAKLNQYRTNVTEAIEMCKRENTEVKGDFNLVYGEERQIQNMLIDNPSVLQRTTSYQDIPQSHQTIGKLSPFGQKLQKPDEILTPYQGKTIQNVSQLSHFVPQFSQVVSQEPVYSPSNLNQKISRKQSENLYQQQDYQDYINQPIMTFGSNQPSVENLKHSLNKIKSAKELNLSDHAVRMIEDIERKAFEEIQKLRREKLQLMQRLNQEIKNVNQEKKRNAQLSALLNSYTNQAQRPDGSYAGGQNIPFLKAQIKKLQSDLQRANDLNNNLRLEMSHRGSGVPGIEQLLRQGEMIRQQTLRLIKLKEQGDSNERVQQLERRLASEQFQKQAALNELKSLKQGAQSGSRNRRFQQVESYQRSVKVTSPFDKGTAQYEDMVSEMKRITGY